MWVFIFSFAKERLREEKRTKVGSEGVGGEGDIRYHVIFPVMLTGYGSSQHCSYALMYTYTCTHAFTHTHITHLL